MHIPALAASALALLSATASASPWPPTRYNNAAAAAAALTAGGPPYCPPRAASPPEQKAIFNAFVQKLVVEQNATRAFLDHVAEDYIQHNPNFLSGRQTAIDGFAQIPPGLINNTIINQGFDADRGWVHYRMDVRGAPRPSAVVDILRMEGTCIREHWDVIQERPDNATNPLAMW